MGDTYPGGSGGQFPERERPLHREFSNVTINGSKDFVLNAAALGSPALAGILLDQQRIRGEYDASGQSGLLVGGRGSSREISSSPGRVSARTPRRVGRLQSAI